MDATAIDFPAETFAVLKGLDIRQVATVPDAGHATLIRLCDADPDMTVVPLTTEEEGIALLAGAWWGGQRGVLLMQSSGVGNCINMLSLPLTYRLPLVMLVTMRGDWGEFNPMQVPMGQGTQPVLEAMGVLVRRADTAADVAPAVEGLAKIAFNAGRPAAVLIGQRVIGAKNFAESQQ